MTDYEKDIIFIKKRKGFIKYALQYNYKVYPIYIFNEHKMFYTMKSFEKIRLFLNKFKIPAVLFISKYIVFPFRVNIWVAVAKRIFSSLIFIDFN